MVTLDTLRTEQRDEILRLAKRRGALSVRVFGSVVRGDAGEGSDLDLLVEWEPGRDLLDHAGLAQDLRGIARDESPYWHGESAPLVRARQDPPRGHATVKDDRLYVHQMLERCQRINRFIGPGREFFMTSEELQDAVIRNLEVIGEAAKRVSPEARDHMASLDWKGICGMRDILIHDYMGVDLDEVWNVVSSRIPALQAVPGQFLAGSPPDPKRSQ